MSAKQNKHNPLLNPDIYKGLHAKGGTPLGTHIPVLLEEVMAILKPQQGQIIADCTLGYGGHALEFMKRIGPTGKLIGFDMDGIELERTKKRLSNASDVPLSFYHENFAEIGSVLDNEKIDGYDIIFADLGVSSMQVDSPERGVSYKNKGPLDMRMDTRLKQTGADLLEALSFEELSKALWDLADEPDNEKIAAAIVTQRDAMPITQTSQLIRLVFKAKGLTLKTWKQQQQNSREFGALHPAARTFQALRILVNDELNALKKLLQTAPYCLRPGGKIGIISFHSGEDRLVKHSFKEGFHEGLYESATNQPLVPRVKERINNPRSSSAKFRWAKKAL